MRRWCILLACCVAVIGKSGAQSFDAKALRDVVEMPKTTVWFGVGFDSATRSIKMTGDKEERPARIAAIEKALVGDMRDAERLGQLADLYENESKSKETAARGLALAKQLVAANPTRSDGHRILGEAFERVDERGEAEKAFREAVRLGPESERCWSALGTFLATEVYRELVGKESFDFGNLAAVLRKNRIDAARVVKLARVQSEASVCFDKAVGLNPKGAQPYRERAGYRLWMAMLADALVQANLQTADDLVLPANRRDREFLADMKKAAELEPESPRNIALPMLFEFMTLGDVQEMEAQQKDPLSSLSRYRKQLTVIANGADPLRAGEALYVLGLLESLPGGDAAKSIEHFRRDETLRPDSRQSEAQLDASLFRSKNYAQLAERCEARLRTRDDPHTRYAAARVCWATGEFPKAEEHVRAGLKLELTDTLCNLSLAAVLLRKGDAKALEEARLLLRKSKSFIDSEHTVHFATLSAILAALSGDVRSARADLRDLAVQQPEDSVCVRALKVLGGSESPDALSVVLPPLPRELSEPSEIPNRLRACVKMPPMRYRINAVFNGDGTLEFENVTPDHAVESATLEKSLDGGPDDLDRYCRLGAICESPTKRKEIGDWAVELAVRLRRAEPANGKLALAAGRIYIAVDDTAEAERTLREAVRLLPSDSDCWIGLGRCLSRCAAVAAWGRESVNVPPFSAVSRSNLPEIRDAAKVRRFLDEADDCFARAIALAPKSERPYRMRAAARFMNGMFCRLLEANAEKDVPFRMFSGEVFADLETCADMTPEDPLPRGVLTYFRILIATDAGWLLPSVSGEDSPDYVREKKFIAEQRKRLETLSKHRDPAVAGNACYILAVLSLVERRNFSEAMPYLKRDEFLLPNRTRSTLLIENGLFDGKKFDETFAHAEGRVKEHDSPFSRFVLAHRSFGEGDLGGAEKHLRSGLKLAAEDLECDLGLAAVLLRRGDKGSLDEANNLLTSAKRLVRNYPDRLYDVTVLRCVHLAMTGDVESARRRLQELVAAFPAYEPARSVLNVVGE